jgi:Tol biopolymer transport system component
MSPEQIRGEAVDHRSDIFSFGAVLYEMLSGRRAFRGHTPAETLAAILKEDPPEISETGRGIPPGLARIVHRCLEKRPGDRFHSAHDLALALEAVSSGASRPSWLPLVPRRRLLGAGALVAIAAIAGLWAAWPRESEAPPSPLRIRPLTSEPGVELSPALSPDGNLVAFIRVGESGEADLCVKQVDGGGEPLVIGGGTGRIFTPTWSPDGQRLAFFRRIEAEDGAPRDAVFVISALGGPTRHLGTFRSPHGLSWSPDGKLLAVPHRADPEGPSSLYLLLIESGERSRLTSPPPSYSGDSQPRFSPDGRTLAFVRAEMILEDDIYLVPIEGGAERRLTEGNRGTEGLAWTPDGRGIAFSSSRSGGTGSNNLWWVPVSGGDPELLEFGGHGIEPTISRGGGRLAYTKLEFSMDIWRVGGPSAPEDDERSPTRLIASTWPDLYPRYSPDGQQIAFASGRSGAGEIWICDSDGSNPRQLTMLDDPMIGVPAWSPNGEEIAFWSRKGGSDDVYVVSTSGGFPRRLTTGSAIEVTSWSRDGSWVYFFSSRSGRHEVWKVPAQGGDALQVTTQGGAWAFESHDGRFLYFGKSTIRGGPPGVWRMPRDGGKEVQVQDRASLSHWALLEEGILYVDFGSGASTLELFHFATGEVSRVAVAEHGPDGPGLSVSPDGRWVLYVGGEKFEADIMLVEGFE